MLVVALTVVGPRILILNYSVGVLRHFLGSICTWNNLEFGIGRYPAAEYYQTALESGKDYDIIIMADTGSKGYDPEGVRKLREVQGFNGYLVCVVRPPIESAWAKLFLDQGANMVVQDLFTEEDVVQVRKGMRFPYRTLL